MLLKVFFDKTVFVTFKISNTFEQNIGETDLKQPKVPYHTSFWVLKIWRKESANQKISDFCQSFVISTK